MIALLRAEVHRFTSRRLMRVLAVATLAILALILLRVASISEVRTERPPAPPQFIVDEHRQACEQAKARGEIPPSEPCDIEYNQAAYEVDQRVHARTALREATTAATVVVALLAFVAAASYVGAEWHHGTMQALLFWEPRRGRVLFAKAAAAVLVSLAFMLVLQVVTYAGTYLIAATRGTTTGVTSGLHISNLLLVLRGGVFVSIVALLSYAIAGLARITGAALGAAFFYFAIFENVIAGVRPGWERWLITRNVAAILAQKIQVQPAHPPRGPGAFEDQFLEFRMYTLTSTRGVITLGVYLTILLGAYYLVFTRRDVT
ncbi:MAG TPA: ABC transporter permease [Frankiaceae bacterium]|nr:ABC transporter permease [Frankiaceae bacterium]